ncbi:MAG: hypothetical protein O7G83_19285, partial [Proteobacteria bacterium]|nr:hypothetical protein [Pseudomonadota bacterium]
TLQDQSTAAVTRKFPAVLWQMYASSFERLGDEPSRLNHAIITQWPIELIAKPHLTTWLVTRISGHLKLSPLKNHLRVSRGHAYVLLMGAATLF